MDIVRTSLISLCCAALWFTAACSSSEQVTTADASVPTDAEPIDAATLDGGDAAPIKDAALPDAPIVPLGTCSFTVDGTSYTSADGDPFTLATLKDGSLSVQCVASTATTRLTINLAAKVAGAGQSEPGIAQLSEQPVGGGSPVQYQSFTSPISVSSLSPSAVSGTSTFNGGKAVTVNFNLALK